MKNTELSNSSSLCGVELKLPAAPHLGKATSARLSETWVLIGCSLALQNYCKRVTAGYYEWFDSISNAIDRIFFPPIPSHNWTKPDDSLVRPVPKFW